MSAPLVSIIVPVYNGERFLGEAIQSIVDQTYAPIEIVVVDDGSTDKTADVAQSFGDRVIYVHQENAGPVVARNRGLETATGAFIGFLDSDDVYKPEKIAVQMAQFEQDPDLGICVAHVLNFWEDELADERERFRDHARAKPIPGYTTQTLLAPRRVYDDVGGFDTSLAHGDSTDWFLRAERAGVKKVLLDDIVALRRMHKASLSRNAAGDSREEFLKLVKAALDRKRG